MKVYIYIFALCALLLLVFGAALFGSNNAHMFTRGEETKVDTGGIGGSGAMSCTWSKIPSMEWNAQLNTAANEQGIQPALLAAMFIREHSGSNAPKVVWPSVPPAGQERSWGGWGRNSATATGPFQITDNTWPAYCKVAVGPNDPKVLEKCSATDTEYRYNFALSAKVAAAVIAARIQDPVGASTASSREEPHIRGVALAYASGDGAYETWRDSDANKGKSIQDWVLSPSLGQNVTEKKKYQNDVWNYFEELITECTANTANGASVSSADAMRTEGTAHPWMTWQTDQLLSDVEMKKLSPTYSACKSGGGNLVKNETFHGKMPLGPKGIVLHWTGGDSASLIGGFKTSDKYVHLVIGKDGVVHKLIPLNTWVDAGSGDANPFAIGIEIVGNNQSELQGNADQKKAVISTVKWLAKTYNIPMVKGTAETLEPALRLSLNARVGVYSDANKFTVNNLSADATAQPSGIFGHSQTQCVICYSNTAPGKAQSKTGFTRVIGSNDPSGYAYNGGYGFDRTSIENIKNSTAGHFMSGIKWYQSGHGGGVYGQDCKKKSANFEPGPDYLNDVISKSANDSYKVDN